MGIDVVIKLPGHVAFPVEKAAYQIFVGVTGFIAEGEPGFFGNDRQIVGDHALGRPVFPVGKGRLIRRQKHGESGGLADIVQLRPVQRHHGAAVPLVEVFFVKAFLHIGVDGLDLPHGVVELGEDLGLLFAHREIGGDMGPFVKDLVRLVQLEIAGDHRVHGAAVQSGEGVLHGIKGLDADGDAAFLRLFPQHIFPEGGGERADHRAVKTREIIVGVAVVVGLAQNQHPVIAVGIVAVVVVGLPLLKIAQIAHHINGAVPQLLLQILKVAVDELIVPMSQLSDADEVFVFITAHGVGAVAVMDAPDGIPPHTDSPCDRGFRAVDRSNQPAEKKNRRGSRGSNAPQMCFHGYVRLLPYRTQYFDKNIISAAAV